MAAARPFNARRELARLAGIADDDIDLADAGLALAALDHPGRDPALYREVIGDIATAVAAATGSAEASGRATGLATVMTAVFHLVSDERDDDEPGSGDLMHLLDHRRGPALSVGLLWLHVGRALGWPIEALAFPGPFLLRIGGEGGGRVIIDPSQAGCRLDAASLRHLLKIRAGGGAELELAHSTPLSNRAALLRLQTAAKLRCLRHAQLARAVAAVEAALLFAPDQAGLWREAGLMHLRLDNRTAAIAALDQFVARAPDTPVRHRTCVLLQELRQRLS